MTIQIVRHGQVCELPPNRIAVYKKNDAGKILKDEDGLPIVASVKEEPQENDFPNKERAAAYLDKLLDGIMARADQHPRHAELIKSASRDGWKVVDTDEPEPEPEPEPVDRSGRSFVRGSSGTTRSRDAGDDDDDDDEDRTPAETPAGRGGGGAGRPPPKPQQPKR